MRRGPKRFSQEEKLKRQSLVREILNASKGLIFPENNYDALPYNKIKQIAFCGEPCITGITAGPGTHLVRGPFGMCTGQYDVPEGKIYVSIDADIRHRAGGATYIFSRDKDAKLKLED